MFNDFSRVTFSGSHEVRGSIPLSSTKKDQEVGFVVSQPLFFYIIMTAIGWISGVILTLKSRLEKSLQSLVHDLYL